MVDRNASEIRSVFGENLRALCTREKSVAGVANAIGINRTQFNRFLNGESYPRPDVLVKICDYFEVDTRIFTHSLSDIDVLTRFEHPYLTSLYKLFPESVQHSESSDLQPGFYRYWKNAFNFKDKITMAIFFLYLENDMLRFKGTAFVGHHNSKDPFIPHQFMKYSKPGYQQVYGTVFKLKTGNAFLLDSDENTSPLCFGFVSQSSLFNSIYKGYSVLAEEQLSDKQRLVRVVFEKASDEFSEAMAIRRQIGLYDVGDVPDHILSLLEPDQPVA